WINARRGGVIGLVLGNVANEARVDSAVATSPPPAKGVPPAAAPTPAAQNPSASSPLRQQVAARMSSATRYLFPFLSSTVEVAGGIIIIIFLSIYIAVDPDLYRRGLMSLFPRKGRAHAGEVLSAIAAVLRKWLVTQLIAMVTLGAVTVAALLLLGVKAAIALGLLAGLLEFIPTIGPIISALPAIAMGFLDSPQKALWVALVYLGLHFCETHMMIPLLMKGGIDLPPALTIVAQALMALLFGFIGL